MTTSTSRSRRWRNLDVDLPGGARLHIHPTPALVAIDVDAGGATAERRQGGGATGGEPRGAAGAGAADPAAQPVRRDPGGFCRAAGPAAVRAGTGAERRVGRRPAAAAAARLHRAGAAEIVRPRVHPPLHELLAGPHAAGLAALRAIATQVGVAPHRLPALRASPAVVAALQADPEALADLARRTGRALMLRADPGLPATAWIIEAAR